MAKRSKKVEEKKEEKAEVKAEEKAEVKVEEKKAEGGNGEDKSAGTLAEPKATVVSPDYDAMPDEVEDPANVYRMALLETRRTALQNKRLYLELHYNNQMASIRKKMSDDFARIDGEIKELKKAHTVQRDYIESKHGIALKSYNYNDETGVLTKEIPTGAEEVATNG